jgi:hypothetical protein
MVRWELGSVSIKQICLGQFLAGMRIVYLRMKEDVGIYAIDRPKPAVVTKVGLLQRLEAYECRINA